MGSISPYSIFLKILRILFQNGFFKEQVKVRRKIEGKEQSIAVCPCGHAGMASLARTSLTRAVLLLQLVSLH